jgi:hypothetical protein
MVSVKRKSRRTPIPPDELAHRGRHMSERPARCTTAAGARCRSPTCPLQPHLLLSCHHMFVDGWILWPPPGHPYFRRAAPNSSLVVSLALLLPPRPPSRHLAVYRNVSTVCLPLRPFSFQHPSPPLKSPCATTSYATIIIAIRSLVSFRLRLHDTWSHPPDGEKQYSIHTAMRDFTAVGRHSVLWLFG